eukprot:TRINITY_DN3405_c0_g1_i1.p1 TRINITY_DN3405_c0_g1~~TRINITY_DN3405_c0_g1_i1.p1  ORF type:complete len:197 (+),score=50.52 TRINITY_DN3405_c0_g1_i1:364-954(+)
MSTAYDYVFKLKLVGDKGVGKSSILARAVDNTFSDAPVSTFEDFKLKVLVVEGKRYKLAVFDTASKERISIRTTPQTGFHGVILIFDVTNRVSFSNLKHRIAEIDREAYEPVSKILVGNKSDLEEARAVTTEEGTEFANSLGIPFIETSAKSGSNVEELFSSLSESIMIRVSLPLEQQATIDSSSQSDKNTKCIIQ